MRILRWWNVALCAVAMSATSFGAEPGDGLTKTRPEMKKKIEALKQRESRIPLPALTEAEIAAGKRTVNNGRLR